MIYKTKKVMQMQKKVHIYQQLLLNNTYTTYDMNYDNNTYRYPYDSQNVTSANLSWNIFSFGETKYKHESKFKKII